MIWPSLSALVREQYSITRPPRFHTPSLVHPPVAGLPRIVLIIGGTLDSTHPTQVHPVCSKSQAFVTGVCFHACNTEEVWAWVKEPQLNSIGEASASCKGVLERVVSLVPVGAPNSKRGLSVQPSACYGRGLCPPRPRSPNERCTRREQATCTDPTSSTITWQMPQLTQRYPNRPFALLVVPPFPSISIVGRGLSDAVDMSSSL